MRVTIGVLALMLLFAGQLAAKIPEGDGVRGRKALTTELQALLEAENFRELDRRAASYAKNKTVFPDGWWKLTQFFLGLGNPEDKKDATAWQRHLEHIANWVAASPANDTALTAQGVALTRYAWSARGGGYANTVTQEGWYLFAERLARARSTLDTLRDRLHKGTKPGAGWYTAMLTIAMGQGWARNEYEQLFQEAVAAHPDYYEFYLKKGTYLLPRWFGAEGEWQQFARDAGQKLGPDVFARICWSNASLEGYSDLFTKLGITWEEVSEGFIELRRKNPKSVWTLSAYCRLAGAAKQRSATATLIKELGDDYYSEAWPSEEYYRKLRAWALATERP